MNILSELRREFKNAFGYECENNNRLFFAPGRVNLIGEHTDYNGGYVFPCAISFGTYAIASKRKGRKLRLYSLNLKNEGIIERELGAFTPLEDNKWSAYPMGIIWTLINADYDIDSGFDMVIYGDIPNGSGLSSSASLEVLTGVVLRELFDLKALTNVDIAKFAREAENKYCGVKCGIMDQFASSMGRLDHAILLNTSSLEHRYIRLALKNQKIVIVNTNVKHNLAASDYNKRREECQLAYEAMCLLEKKPNLCSFDINELEEARARGLFESDIIYKRARHAISESTRCLEAVKALNNSDIVGFGKLMNSSHISLRDDFEVSCKELDTLVDIALSIDKVHGARMTGGGFGGCIVSIVDNESVDKFSNTILSEYKAITGIEAALYVASPGNGADILKEEL